MASNLYLVSYLVLSVCVLIVVLLRLAYLYREETKILKDWSISPGSLAPINRKIIFWRKVTFFSVANLIVLAGVKWW